MLVLNMTSMQVLNITMMRSFTIHEKAMLASIVKLYWMFRPVGST